MVKHSHKHKFEGIWKLEGEVATFKPDGTFTVEKKVNNYIITKLSKKFYRVEETRNGEPSLVLNGTLIKNVLVVSLITSNNFNSQFYFKGKKLRHQFLMYDPSQEALRVGTF